MPGMTQKEFAPVIKDRLRAIQALMGDATLPEMDVHDQTWVTHKPLDLTLLSRVIAAACRHGGQRMQRRAKLVSKMFTR